MMDLRLLAYFVAVVDHGGVTKAAHSLFIAQPSLSQAIRALERQADTTLFDRAGGRLTLTPDGQALLVAARKVLTDVEEAKEKVAAVRTGRAGRLRIAALSTLSTDPLPELVAMFTEQHPGLRVDVLDPKSGRELLVQIRRGDVELGFTTSPESADGLVVEHLWVEELVAVAAPHIFEGVPDPVPLTMLSKVPLVMEPADTGTRAGLDAIVAPKSISIAVECELRDALWALVEVGAGATLLPNRIARTHLRGVEVRATDPPLHQAVALVHRPGPQSPAAQSFLSLVRSWHAADGAHTVDSASSTNARPAGESDPSSKSNPNSR